MQIVIDISEEKYDTIKNKTYCGIYDAEVYKSIANGILLPKGHGDLVDRGKINDRFYGIWKELESYSNQPTYKQLLDKLSMCLDTASIIVEEDEEDEE